MKRILNWFVRVVVKLLGAASDIAPPAVTPAPPWTSDDRDNWKRFLTGTTGRKLLLRLTACSAANALASCRDKRNTAVSAASAGGYDEAVQHIISLSWSAHAPVENSNVGPGEAPGIEPRPQDSVEEFLLRNSP
jgi:hypothetical protein